MRARSASTIGRADELATIERALRAAGERTGAAVFLVGEPGIGKTRLASEAVSHALDAGMAVLRGRASTTGPTVPFRPLTEALMPLARGGSHDLVARLGVYRHALGRLVPDWVDPDAGGDQSLVVLSEAVLRLAALAGERHGCLLVLDDLQDADVETLGVVDYLCSNLAGLPVCLLGAVRDQPGEALELASTAGRRGDGEVVTLRRLHRAEVHELVASCLETPAGSVPDEVSGLLFEQSAGTPLVVDELLDGLVGGGDLVRGTDGWRLHHGADGGDGGAVPPTLVSSVARRVERLGEPCRHMLSVAAVFGQRFPLSVVQRVTGLDDHALLGNVQAAVAGALLAPDAAGPDWYTFRHPLTVEALLGTLSPARRTTIAGEVADAVLADHPELPGQWCHAAAALRLHEGRRHDAGRLYLRAGRRALRAGAPGSAVSLLEQAEPLLPEDERVDLLGVLLDALAADGRLERADRVAADLRRLTGDTTRQVAAAVRLAWAAHIAGRWDEGARQVAMARALVRSAGPNERDTVAIDTVEAYLMLVDGGPEGPRRAEQLARVAVEGAVRHGLFDTACRAWYAVGLATRERDLAESDASFRRMLALADEADLATWHCFALAGLGGNAWLATADTAGLERAHAEAVRTGGVTPGYNVEAVLGLDAALRGDAETAAHRLASCLAATRRMRLTAVVRYALMAEATLAGQRGDRAAMAERLAELARWGTDSTEMVLARGLASVFCSLLHEDRDAAVAELDVLSARKAAQPGGYHLAGAHGLALLLDVLAGRAGREEHAAIAGTGAGRMRWNRHFVLLAEAVLLGREGSGVEASAARHAATAEGEPFRTAQALGQRLVAEAAVEDGWGDPSQWLRQAEEYFHRMGAWSAASACRGLLRQAGAPVGQRRTGVERVPAELRRLGVTVREFEVYELLTQRLGNKAVAARLHISPRTVEKHVASLLAKTGVPDRDSLATRSGLSARVLRGRPPLP